MTQKRTILIEGKPTEITIENYSQQEIIKLMKGMGILLKEEDLTRPNCARITHLFECILYTFTPWLAETIEAEREEANRISQNANMVCRRLEF